ncbi:phage tail tape measure protein [Pseudomonas aeruginosa]|uniref:phage tail tape measure protein n=1 Tax=Pseudomonas aeruginosa TaxID=287 RepID=UPI00132493A9|nr:phage tail tape measure protein [Pseudomonas aeruginosa]MWV92274.1 phage tail tape measure protein [Pseudomonas aeruginosa]MWW68617.1 phage tail tape measure protein [Pseudomonas aeruginosa]
MASRSLGTLTLDLIAKVGGFVAGMDAAERRSAKWRAQVEKDMKAAGKTIGIALGAGATAAATALVLVVNKQRDLIDQQAKAAQMLDTTYTSLANLGRAGELGGVGMEKIEAASRQLNLNIGRAIGGTKSQAEAFERLGLSAQDVYELPLDQRIATINQALRDNVQASERASVAADIYGAKNAKAIQQLDPGTIAEAARQVELFGLNLSDVDAAKVEMANDALSTFGLLGDGIAKQLTVELAPILKAVGDLFLESAEEAGGLGNVVQDSVQTAVNALAFLADAADGVKRVFELAADAIITGFSKASSIVANNAASILNVVSYLPGVDYSDTVSSLRQFATEANGVAREAMANIDQTLSRPLAGQAFKQFYADAQKAAEDSAQATIDAREEVKKTGDAFVEESSKSQKAIKQTVDAIDSQIRALQLQAEMVGMSTREQTLFKLALDGATQSQLDQAEAALNAVDAFDKVKKQQEDYKSLVADLRTEEEQLTDQMRERLAVLDAMQGLSDEERNRVASRIVSESFSAPPSFDGADAVVAGPQGELDKIDKAEEELEKWYQSQLDLLNANREAKAELTAQWDEQELKLKQEHEEALAAIERSRQQVTLSANEQFFGNLSGLAKSFFGEQSGLYKAAFVAEKSYAIAKTLLNAPKTASDAYAAMAGIPVIGPALGIAAAAAAVTAQLAQVAAVKNVNLSGQAHDGIMSVPEDGTWNLKKGERVTTAETSAKLDRTLDDVRRNQASAGAPTINLIEDRSRAGQVNTRRQDDQYIIDVVVADLFGDGRSSKAIGSSFGIRRSGT